MTRPAAWIDIQATDAEQARRFYGSLFGWEINVIPEMNYGVFAPGPERLPGGIAQATAEGHPVGICTYFTVDDVASALDQAEQLGAQVAVPAWTIPEMGTMAVVLDPDGNRVGLWAPATEA